MILVSRSGKNPNVYIPPIRPDSPGIGPYFLALEIHREAERRRGTVKSQGQHRAAGR